MHNRTARESQFMLEMRACWQHEHVACMTKPSTAGKWRGVVVTGACAKGDLLAACRPLAVASKHPIDLEADCYLGCLVGTAPLTLTHQSTPVRVTCGAYSLRDLRLLAHTYIPSAGWRHDALFSLQIQVCISACCLLGPAMLTVLIS